MIRIILAIIAIIASLASMAMGQHPSFSIMGTVLALVLVGWSLSDKEAAGLLR